MRISAIHTRGVGPLGTQDLAFRSDWSGEIAPTILFSGPNGCGKSTLLRGVAMLWRALGQWMQTARPIPHTRSELADLRRWAGLALVLEQTPAGEGPTVVFVGDAAFEDELRGKYPSARLIGECRSPAGVTASGFSPADTLLSAATATATRRFRVEPDSHWTTEWADARRRMLVSWAHATSPNMVHLDAEERRWVAATRGAGEILADSSERRWLPTYSPTESWNGQLEQSLLALKAAAPGQFRALLVHMNDFLVSKQISGSIIPGENRLRVRLGGRPKSAHLLDSLSSGEHQVLIQLYMVGRWLEPGGVVLIDEPDLHLHPSLIPGFLARLEQMVADRDGQLLLTSHVPQIWDRYEARGLRVALGVQP
ncbi:MAG: AAA family ATPase [Armatimonadetes bacterium]|nr:AAA family ATPase [Armatimonadota bacterium]